jgi:hypothetical protein
MAATVATATIVDVTPAGVAVRSPELGEVFARIAVIGPWTPARGDRVLLRPDARGQRYVVGVVRALREAEAEPFRVEREGHTTRIVVAQGDLELSAPRGQVRVAGEGVELESSRDVAVRARRAIAIESHDGERARSSLRLEGDAAQLEAGVLAARAARLAVIAEDVTALAARLDARIADVRQRAERIETEVGELIERAKESYRETEGLSQTRAGRLRLVAETSLTALAERAKLKAKTIFAIDGESIHLG